jgi:hypothetical protein
VSLGSGASAAASMTIRPNDAEFEQITQNLDASRYQDAE